MCFGCYYPVTVTPTFKSVVERQNRSRVQVILGKVSALLKVLKVLNQSVQWNRSYYHGFSENLARTLVLVSFHLQLVYVPVNTPE